ncbi:hypothetical protein BSQ39_05290 [Loigolactobacillus backii]|uniref:NAD-dependent epimerase/dehydratase family protein n=1 Tax=Loigolactobacillus backii TaxID=375175 RepID=UPI000C1CAA9B|nr:NAD-dependent epimerase/dehydratase family protein [Loigolactobacillus backii]PIO83027.1 hypothetical protein BSQ39_05290 [Loigolactobacillus backii]
MANNNFNFDNDSVFLQDLANNAKNNSLFKNIDGTTVLITGATGLIGYHLVRTLLLRNEIIGSNIKVIAQIRNLEKAKSMYGQLFNDENLIFYVSDICDPISIEGKLDYIIHGASVTSSKMFVENPVQTIDVAYKGTKNILELAKEKKVRKVIYLSSLEVYGIVDMDHPEVTESDLGYIDILSPRSSYSEGKRMMECLARSYYSQYQVPVVIARLAQTFGSGVSFNDTRVFAEFARSAIYNKDIILKTDGSTSRDYCYISDAVQGILLLLTSRNDGEAYNIANEETYTSIKEMANIVAHEITNDKIKVKVNIPKVETNGFAPKLKLKLMSRKIRNLGWTPSYDLCEMYLRLIESMQTRQNSEHHSRRGSNYER